MRSSGLLCSSFRLLMKTPFNGRCFRKVPVRGSLRQTQDLLASWTSHDPVTPWSSFTPQPTFMCTSNWWPCTLFFPHGLHLCPLYPHEQLPPMSRSAGGNFRDEAWQIFSFYKSSGSWVCFLSECQNKSPVRARRWCSDPAVTRAVLSDRTSGL